MGALAFIGDDLDIVDNDALTSLYGLDALTFVEGDLYVYDNGSLCASDVDELVGQLASFSGDVTNELNSGECP